VPGGLKNLEAFRRRDGLFNQGRFADAGLSEDRNRPAVAVLRRHQQPFNYSALAFPTEQHRSHTPS
jgi:hypothetical protein